MNTLPQTKKKNGYLYDLVKRTAQTAMYAQMEGTVNRLIGYEVFRVTVIGPQELFGAVIGEREKFPSNEDFGESAWAFMTLEAAEGCFAALEKNEWNPRKTNIHRGKR